MIDKDDVIEFLMMYGWAILIIIAAVLALFYFGVFPQPSFGFDEERDVCLKEKTTIYTFSMTNNSYNNTECADWRSKTKCELNPVDSSCVCDEYPIENLSDNYTFDFEKSYKFDIILANNSIYHVKFKVQEYAIGGGVKFNNTINATKIKLISIDDINQCIKSHEWTIYDYSCNELKTFIFLEDCPNEIYDDISKRAGCIPDMKKAFVDKGCVV